MIKGEYEREQLSTANDVGTKVVQDETIGLDPSGKEVE